MLTFASCRCAQIMRRTSACWIFFLFFPIAAQSTGEASMTQCEALRELDLKPGFAKTQLKKAYRERSRVTHPDKGGSAEAQFRVEAAKELLSQQPIHGLKCTFSDIGMSDRFKEERGKEEPQLGKEDRAWSKESRFKEERKQDEQQRQKKETKRTEDRHRFQEERKHEQDRFREESKYEKVLVVTMIGGIAVAIILAGPTRLLRWSALALVASLHQIYRCGVRISAITIHVTIRVLATLLCQIYGIAVRLVVLAMHMITTSLMVLATLLYQICGIAVRLVVLAMHMITMSLTVLARVVFGQVLRWSHWILSTLILRRHTFWIAVGFGIAAFLMDRWD